MLGRSQRFGILYIQLCSVCRPVRRCRQLLPDCFGRPSIRSGVESSPGCSQGIRTLPDRLAAEWDCTSIANPQTIGFQTHDRVMPPQGELRDWIPGVGEQSLLPRCPRPVPYRK